VGGWTARPECHPGRRGKRHRRWETAAHLAHARYAALRSRAGCPMDAEPLGRAHVGRRAREKCAAWSGRSDFYPQPAPDKCCAAGRQTPDPRANDAGAGTGRRFNGRSARHSHPGAGCLEQPDLLRPQEWQTANLRPAGRVCTQQPDFAARRGAGRTGRTLLRQSRACHRARFCLVGRAHPGGCPRRAGSRGRLIIRHHRFKRILACGGCTRPCQPHFRRPALAARL